ncbi:MAG: hypothetical protein C5B56_16105 [Proteobacteria bacterium]|nr:MAG: hypothetical protein C5B56_16105 [Pseudomonadota bacterium]
MPRTSWGAFCAGLMAIALSGGCGTVYNVCPKGSWHGPGPKYIYGGLIIDVGVEGYLFAQPFQGDFSPEDIGGNCLTAAFFLADMPFSFVMDTLTLYQTIPSTIARLKNPGEPDQPSSKDDPSVSNQSNTAKSD